MNLPKFVTRFLFRAILPSRRSVIDATMNKIVHTKSITLNPVVGISTIETPKEENGKTYKNIKMKARTNLNKVNLFGKFISFLSF